ncbi:MAG TPA: hypothetical protein VM734_24855 [Kofleriaceae bacterium]|jgi:hypothetical protein|nr:hypothetical protein [Kofleriaceae bacterium]
MLAPASQEPRRLTRNRFHLGEVLRLSFWVWIKNLVPFMALSVLLHGPLLAWAGYLLALGSDAPLEAWSRFGTATSLAGVLVNSLLSAAVTFGVVMELDRRPQPIGRVIALGLRRFLPAIAVVILTSLAIFGATLLLVVPGIIVACMLYVAVPASVIEQPGIRGALGRSRALTAGNRLKVLVLLILGQVVNLGVLVPIAVAVVGDARPHLLPVADLIRSIVAGPLLAVVVATTYSLLRRQRDGAAPDELARVFE